MHSLFESRRDTNGGVNIMIDKKAEMPQNGSNIFFGDFSLKERPGDVCIDRMQCILSRYRPLPLYSSALFLLRETGETSGRRAADAKARPTALYTKTVDGQTRAHGTDRAVLPSLARAVIGS